MLSYNLNVVVKDCNYNFKIFQMMPREPQKYFYPWNYISNFGHNSVWGASTSQYEYLNSWYLNIVRVSRPNSGLPILLLLLLPLFCISFHLVIRSCRHTLMLHWLKICKTELSFIWLQLQCSFFCKTSVSPQLVTTRYRTQPATRVVVETVNIKIPTALTTLLHWFKWEYPF